MSFPPAIKAAALVACGRHCCICHKFCGTMIECHHIVQEADGGANTPENCIPLCLDCHGAVGAYNPRHPRGTKYTARELRAHRDRLYALVASGAFRARRPDVQRGVPPEGDQARKQPDDGPAAPFVPKGGRYRLDYDEGFRRLEAHYRARAQAGMHEEHLLRTLLGFLQPYPAPAAGRTVSVKDLRAFVERALQAGGSGADELELGRAFDRHVRNERDHVDFPAATARLRERMEAEERSRSEHDSRIADLSRLREAMIDAGRTGGRQARAATLRELNARAATALGVSFSDLCRGTDDDAGPAPWRVPYALLTARGFEERPEIGEMRDWWIDEGHEGVMALVGLGGSGKTALAERFLALLHAAGDPRDGERDAALLTAPDRVFVWSFYEDASWENFAHEFLDYLDPAAAGGNGGRAPRNAVFAIQAFLEQHPALRLLAVLDGLERVQSDGRFSALGEIVELPLRQLLRRIASGLGNARVVVTSRYPLSDLEEWNGTGYCILDIDHLPEPVAIRILRNRGVRGSDHVLKTAVDEFGAHALTLDHLAGILVNFFGGNPRATAELPPIETAAGDPADEKQGRRLARLFSFYQQRLDPVELDVLGILGSFRFGVTRRTAETLFVASKERKTMGRMRLLHPRQLRATLQRLHNHRLLSRSGPGGDDRYSVHPAIKNYFYRQLSDTRNVHQSVAIVLTRSEPANAARTDDPATLNTLEELIYHTAAAGDTRNAFSIFLSRLGGFEHLGERLGSYQRGENILSIFRPPHHSDPGTPPGLTDAELREYYSQRARFAAALGNMQLAITSVKASLRRDQSRGEDVMPSTDETRLVEFYLTAGKLPKARRQILELQTRRARTAEEARLLLPRRGLARAQQRREDERDAVQGWLAKNGTAQARLEAYLETVNGLLGFAEGRQGGARSMRPLTPEQLDDTVYGLLWRVWLDLRRFPRESAEMLLSCREAALEQEWSSRSARWRIRLARAYRTMKDPAEAETLLRACLSWANATSCLNVLAEASCEFAELCLERGGMEEAASSWKGGWLVAEECGFRIAAASLQTVAARIALAREDADEALARARHALRISEDPACGFAWGAADALAVMGHAHARADAPADARADLRRAYELYRTLNAPEQHALAAALKALPSSEMQPSA